MPKTNPLCDDPKQRLHPAPFPRRAFCPCCWECCQQTASGFRSHIGYLLSQGHRALAREHALPRVFYLHHRARWRCKGPDMYMQHGPTPTDHLALERTSHGGGWGCLRARLLLPILLTWPPFYRCWSHRKSLINSLHTQLPPACASNKIPSVVTQCFYE